MKKGKNIDTKLSKKDKERLEEEKERRKEKREQENKDTELLKSIKAKLEEEPDFLYTLKNLIDEIPGEIPDDYLFEALKPTFRKKPTLDDILSGKKFQHKSNDSLIVSPESVDMFFYPAHRKRFSETGFRAG